LELKARSLLYLRRFKDVADMLQDYIPSLRMSNEDPSSVSSGEGVKLLSSDSTIPDQSFKCFSVSDLKKKV
ncbi:DnaJ heat shock N-terminal domain-containing family protein, partial [Trifolium medium]|nr:DnaJ heat shock N-terminal domain-containing family protein [Trifolium medium]